MIITRTPYRVSLFGGGTDHPSWFNDNGGAVFSFAIDKYCYINVRELPPFFQHNYRISYSRVEMTKEIDQIEHPAVREIIRKYSPELHLEIHHHGDLPAQSGVGSSSAFAVGLIHTILALKGKNPSASDLADLAIDLEQRILLETVGSQDQVACALGGMNFIEFQGNNRWSATPVVLSQEYQADFESRAVLLFSGISRMSSDVSKGLIQNMSSKSSAMKRTHELAQDCFEIFANQGNLAQIGPMLLESWKLKKEANPDSVTPELENLLAEAITAGATGGKILGAGGGGFCLFWVPPEVRENFLLKMDKYVRVPFSISREGTTRIV
jgi:D-glycero-alpha-D-manno-heptose-7-phosphate kinase